jgi:transcriptional regulator of acetoin/glycerol metabolism
MTSKLSGLAPAAVDRLLRYEWPGNVRELENVMERAVALTPGGRVELDDLPDEIRGSNALPVPTKGPVRPLEEVEKDYILAALELNDGNQKRTAEQLKIGYATLYRKLKKYNDGANQSNRGNILSAES